MPKIQYILMIGDSLCDRGKIKKKSLFNFIPVGEYVLRGNSPMGRFTNGLVWGDHLAANIANNFTIKRLKKKWKLNNTDISDTVISKDRRILKTINNAYFLDDDRLIKYQGKAWIRTYCEGGLLAHSYGWQSIRRPSQLLYGLILSNLKDKQMEIFSDDKAHPISYQDKAYTLTIELSGANDLALYNTKPSKIAVDKAIIARIDNVKKMVSSGYQHFILINLPNLTLAPLFKSTQPSHQALADRCSQYFNAQLKRAVAELQKERPHCSFRIFDANKLFNKIYTNPERYSFDKDKLTKTYVKSKDFIDPSDGLSPASGYMFYDDAHPTADMHALLAAKFYEELSKAYELIDPGVSIKKIDTSTEKQLLSSFRHHYEKKLRHDQHCFFSLFCHSKFNYKQCSLADILKDALDHKGERTFSILNQLGWLDKRGELILELDPLKKAYASIRPDYEINPVLEGNFL